MNIRCRQHKEYEYTYRICILYDSRIRNLWIYYFSICGHPCAGIHKFYDVLVLHVFTSVLTEHSCNDNLHQSSGPLT